MQPKDFKNNEEVRRNFEIALHNVPLLTYIFEIIYNKNWLILIIFLIPLKLKALLIKLKFKEINDSLVNERQGV